MSGAVDVVVFVSAVVLFCLLVVVVFFVGRTEGQRLAAGRIDRAWERRHRRELEALHSAIDSLPTFGSADAPLILLDSVFDFFDDVLDGLEESS